MKMLVPTAGPVPAKKKAEYIINIAKRLGADVIRFAYHAGRRPNAGPKALTIFCEAGRKVRVNVVRILEKGDIVPTIIEFAEKESADLIIMGTSEGKVVAEWLSGGVMEKTKVPVVVIPHEFKKAIDS